MMDAVKAYLSLRRATGFKMANAECLLDCGGSGFLDSGIS